MKKSVLVILLVMANVIVFGQQSSPVDSPAKIDYLQKSKRQNTTGLTIGIAGSTFLTIGMILYFSEYGDGLLGGDPANYNDNRFKTGEAMMYFGTGLMAVSIPFALVARKNKKMAGTYSASLKIENRSCITTAAIKRNYFPAFVFSIDL